MRKSTVFLLSFFVTLSWISALISGGLGAMAHGGGKDLAKKQRSLVRENDLLLLRHNGAGSLLFLEIANFITGAVGPSKPSLADVKLRIKEIGDKLALIVSSRDSQGEAILQSCCSKNIVTFLQDLLKDLFTENLREEVIYTSREEFVLTDAVKQSMLFFRALLINLANELGSDIFSKSRSAAFTRFSGYCSHAVVATLSGEGVYF